MQTKSIPWIKRDSGVNDKEKRKKMCWKNEEERRKKTIRETKVRRVGGAVIK